MEYCEMCANFVLLYGIFMNFFLFYDAPCLFIGLFMKLCFSFCFLNFDKNSIYLVFFMILSA